jgi:diguanylate cyclase (GGDEF)-like protein
VVNLLLVEDSRFYGFLIRNRLMTDLDAQVTWATSLAETHAALEANPGAFLLAIVDLHLEDAPDGEALDAVLAAGVRAVCLSGEMSDATRDAIWAKQVVDYVIKDGPQAIDYVVDLVQRLSTNHEKGVLVVDDSAVSRAQLKGLLALHRYQVFEAPSGEAAMEVLRDHPDIVLMLTDYNMPTMNGFELVQAVRKTHRKEALAVVGISAFGTGYVSARFLKAGANDFLYKPSLTEEFYCRVTENIRALERIRSLEDLATRDFLTGLNNRRYFFATGEKLWANARRGNLQSLGLAMIDIDHFKHINDAYGHDAGDEVLRQVATVLRKRCRAADVLARVGGEEFALVSANLQPQYAEEVFDQLRALVAAQEIRLPGQALHVTVSVGVYVGPSTSLEEMFSQADKALYAAKAAGRNRVVCEVQNA